MKYLKHKDGFWIVKCNDCDERFYWNRLFSTIKPTFYICNRCSKKGN